MDLFVAIAQADAGAARLRGIALPVALFHPEPAEGVHFTLSGDPVEPHEVWLRLVGGIALSEQGNAELTALSALYGKWFDTDGPPVLDASAIAAKTRTEEICAFVIGELAKGRTAQAKRNHQLTRDIAALRVAHEQIQQSFSRLETFVYDGGLAVRTPAEALMPASRPRRIVLAPGGLLEQRLPRSSVGLSDLAVHFAGPSPVPHGTLEVSIATREDDAVAGRWRLSDAELSPGWLRFSLPESLGADPRTPEVRLSWQGDGPVHFDLSMKHPDERYQVRRDGAPQKEVLAVRSWSYIAGCAAPAPVEGQLPSGRTATRRAISREVLERAVSLNGATKHFGYRADHDVLQVHVIPGKVAVGLLPGLLGAPVISIASRISTIAAKAKDIEYRMAVAPAGKRATSLETLPKFAAGWITDWTRLAALETGNLEIAFEPPLDGPHDLYLMTRLADGVTDSSWGWSTFSSLSVTLGSENA